MSQHKVGHHVNVIYPFPRLNALANYAQARSIGTRPLIHCRGVACGNETNVCTTTDFLIFATTEYMYVHLSAALYCIHLLAGAIHVHCMCITLMCNIHVVRSIEICDVYTYMYMYTNRQSQIYLLQVRL